ncbi:MAG: hypothetical protein JW842_07910, partial [Prolixibacteraceae bacterium]|nr:hypothetical protein [Prolixibacteraceae bacterium]
IDNLFMELIQVIKSNVLKSFELLLHPGRFWTNLKDDEENTQSLLVYFLLPGLVVVFVLMFIGEMLFNSVYGILYVDIAIKALREILILFSGYIVAHIIIFRLSVMFALPVTKNISRTIAAYTMTPLLLVSMITGLFPFLGFLDFFAIYSLFLAYKAIHGKYDVTFARNANYLSMLMAALFIAYTAIFIILTKLTAVIFY